jgi:mono/diheme cytochrome c family protein
MACDTSGEDSFVYLCVLCAFVLSVSAGCRQDMHDQPRYKPLAKSDFFGDERSARPLVEDTVARGHLRDDSLLFTGKAGADFADTFPFRVDAAVLRRGQDRFGIYCTPCHGQVGRGDGAVVRRGFRIKPANLHVDRLRQKPAGYFFDVITNGFGAMQDYSAQIGVEDRWAIVAYVRALQLSQNARIEDVPPAHRGELEPGGKR